MGKVVWQRRLSQSKALVGGYCQGNVMMIKHPRLRAALTPSDEIRIIKVSLSHQISTTATLHFFLPYHHPYNPHLPFYIKNDA